MKAIGDGSSYTDSAESGASGAYSYTASVTSAALSSHTGNFAIYTPGNVTTTITWNSATEVTGVYNGSTALSSSYYEVSGATLTVKQGYLENQAVGSVVLTVSFNQGNPATLTIAITDSTPPTISPVSANYDLSAPDNVITTITWNSANTVMDVVYGSNPLTTPDAYAVTGNAFTIKNTYLSSLAPLVGDTLVFDISFDTNDTAALTVHVVNNYTPSGDADLSDLRVGGGTGGGLFAPEEEITREQLAAMLYRYAEYMGYDLSAGENSDILSHNDAPAIAEYAFSALQWACGAGILQGDDLGNLNPAGSATRAEAAAILRRFLENAAG